MFFRRSEEHHKRSTFLPLVIFRLCLAVAMFAFLALLMYQAFRYFSSSSGSNPLPTNPKDALVQILQENNKLEWTNNLSSFRPPKNFAEIKQLISQMLSGKSLPVSELVDETMIATEEPNLPVGEKILRFALISDSHNDNDNLAKALVKAQDEGAKFVIGLGDYTQVGTLEELQKTKDTFQAAGLPYYLTSGDHDLWSARDKGLSAESLFNQVFGSSYQSFRDGNILFVILFDSDNYEGVDGVQMDWVAEQLNNTSEDKQKQTYIFLHEPLYHPTSDHVMGKTNKKLSLQAQTLRTLFKENNIKGVFAGDAHAFTQYQDPDNNIKMYTIGSLSNSSNPAGPRFALVDIFDNGSYNVIDLSLN